MSLNETIKYIAEFFKDDPDTFYQIMFVFHKVKIGFLGQFGDINMYDKLKFPINALGLFMSKKHGMYISHNKSRFKSWDGIRFFLNKKRFASYYLDYPKCCEIRDRQINTLNVFEYYYLMKKILIDKDQKSEKILKTYILTLMEICHIPCTTDCPSSIEMAIKFQKVRKMYNYYNNYEYNRFIYIKKYICTRLDMCLNEPILNHFKNNLLPLVLKNKKILRLNDESISSFVLVLENISEEIVFKGKEYVMSL